MKLSESQLVASVCKVRYRRIARYRKYRVGDDGSVWRKWGQEWRRIKGTKGTTYPVVHLSRNNRVKTVHVHKLVLEAFVGPCPEGMECRHLDNDTRNNCLTNIMWDTPVNNAADKVDNGTVCRGENNGRALLTMIQARKVRRLYATGQYKQSELAEMFGVCQVTVSSIVLNKTYKED